MRITPSILYGLLSERFETSRYGKGVHVQELSLPTLYESGMKPVPGGVYVARTGDLPNRPPEGCVIICCGTKPPKVWNMWFCDVIHIVDPHTNLVGIFNTTLEIIDGILRWEDQLQRLALSGAHMREMVEVSIPIFDNPITVSDYELGILATSELDWSLPGNPVVIDDRKQRVPPQYISATKDYGIDLVRKREPYIAEEIANPDEGITGASSYCINLYYGDAYAGTCALKEEKHPFRSYDKELFQTFAGFVHDCLGVQSRSTGTQLVSAHAVFEQILRGYPVSMRDMTRALRLIELGMQVPLEKYRWCCSVIQNMRSDKGLSEAYLCNTVEDLVRHTIAFMVEGSIVAFSLIESGKHRKDEILPELESFLEDMDFSAGVSRTFSDPFHARTFYQQAMTALELGRDLSPERRCHFFGDHVLDYMLQNCCGDFDTKSIVAPELVRLYECGPSGPDYLRTLRIFLDNNCNVTHTAEEMFLHRSTLIKRLEKIREFVNIDTPDRRLYLRMCLHLPDVEEVLAKGVDIGRA